MALLVIVIAKVAPAAILGVVIVICPTRPFSVAVVVPEVVAELSKIPLPAVDETKFPAVAVILPEVAVMLVPAFTAPAVAVTFPVVAVTPVPPVTVVVAEREVVVVNEPGAVIAAGRDSVTVEPEAAVVIWLAVPAILILPLEGVAVPVSPVKLESSDEPPPEACHEAEPADTEVKVHALFPDLLIHSAPRG